MALIEDYGLIGDGEIAALVSREGSIDWLCWPRFDSDACFAALLGEPQHGRWLIAPVGGPARITRAYRGDSLILETRFETEEGCVHLVDFMPPRGSHSHVVRGVVCDSGSVEMQVELAARFGYGANALWLSQTEDGSLRLIAGPDMAVLRTPVDLRRVDGSLEGRFRMNAGDKVAFTLSYGRSHKALPPPVNPHTALLETERFWSEWASHFQRPGEGSADILRSLITLKAMIYAPSGGMVAAITTSLPEQLGGQRNWDYRYCWVRDATLTLLALMNAGYYEEAGAWRDWLLRAVAGSPAQMQIMYGIGGERRLDEWLVPWLPGYEQSPPVRIGNAASGQFQLDVYGELMDALYHARRGGLVGSEPSWELQRALMDHVEKVWQHSDEGIWEVRGPRQHFTHSKVMAWVAVDRAIKSVEGFGLQGPLEHWRELRERIHADVCAKGYDVQRNSFMQAYGSQQLDASLLLLPQLGFLPATDPRVLGTIAAIEQNLLHDGFVQRYDTASGADGLPPGEGVFLACSFWLADAYALCGRQREARELFQRLLALRNNLGLLAEEYDPASRRLLGNFPQAFSHVALVNTALNLSRGEHPAEQRPG